MKKKIWLINQYAMPPELESRLRTIKFAHYLTQAGYDVTIFASSVMHNMNKNLITDNSLYIEKTYNDLRFVHINTQNYNSNGINRFFGLWQFPFRLKRIAHLFEKPDIIIQTATVPFGNILYSLAKKHKALYIVEVLDLWPETFVDLGMVSKKNPLLWLAYKAEKWQYKKADRLVFSMEGGKDYIIDKKWDTANGGPVDLDKVFYINNGVDLKDFEYNLKNYTLTDKDLNDVSTKKVIYIGSIRLANNLKSLIDAAEFLKNDSSIKFLLYGDGEDREPLKLYCKEKELNNVIFKEKWIQPQYVPYLLSKSDVNILNYMPGSFGYYGGSQSKMFQYMASGKPICCNLEMMYCPIKKNNIGIAKEFSSSDEYAKSIKELLYLQVEDYNNMCERAKNTAKEFDYKFLTNKLMQLFD